MATGVYNGFSGEFRDSQGRKQMELVAQGVLPPPTECYMCHQTQGRIVYHLEDYNDIMDVSMPMCFMCHMTLHCCRRAKTEYRSQARLRYWKMYCDAVVNDGYQKLLTNPQPLFKAINEGVLL